MSLNCPTNPEEVAELHVMRRLAGDDLAGFEQHLLNCPRCIELVRQTREFTEAVKSASENL
jgi:hypothetical protein